MIFEIAADSTDDVRPLLESLSAHRVVSAPVDTSVAELFEQASKAG